MCIFISLNFLCDIVYLTAHDPKEIFKVSHCQQNQSMCII